MGPRRGVRLTRRRQEQARQIRDEWQRHALTTAPADRPAAERAARGLYQLDGRPVPRFVWAGSPAGALREVGRRAGGHPGAAADGLLSHLPRRSPLPSAAFRYEQALARNGRLRARLRPRGDLGPVLSAPPARIGTRTRERLLMPGDDWGLLPLEPALLSALRACAAAADGPGGLLPAFAGQCMTGQFDAAGIGADLVYRQLGIAAVRPDYGRRLDLLAALARSSGPWWPYPDVCVLTERPVRFEVQPWSPGGGRRWLVLHSLDGPALAWPDGFAIHAWHGAEVPERFAVGEATAEDWLGEPNAEFRRLIAERMGYAWLLDEMAAHQIASDEYGTLWRIPSHRDRAEDVVVVDVANSTPEPDGSRRRYVLRVPPDQRVPRDAIGWTFGLPPGTYEPTVMT